MSKRNVTLLIIVLIIIIIGIFGFLYFSNTSSQPGSTATGTNFLSNLLSFGKNKNIQPTATGPANISGYVPNTTTAQIPAEKLTKISSMPIAGFGVFMKERFITVPVVTPTTTDTSTTAPTGESTTPPASTSSAQTTTTKTTTSSKKATKTKVVKPTAPLTESVPALRYVDKATGNIYETFADTINETQFTNTIVPKVYDAYFTNKCQTVAMRYLNDDGKTIETFIGALPQEILGDDSMRSNQIKGSFLPENITNLNVSPDSTRLFYLFNLGENDSSTGITADSSGNKKIQVFSSPFTEWTSWWPNNAMLTLTTKPSTGVPGYMYAVNPDKKDLNKVLGNINGLTTLTSPSGKLVLYSDDNLSLSIYDTNTRQSNPTGLKTLPEKCTWNINSNAVYCAVPKFVEQTGYPDIWYQGVVSFADAIWKIDITNGTTSLISDPGAEKGEDIDGIKLALDTNESYLFFVNKKDSYLWELNLK